MADDVSAYQLRSAIIVARLIDDSGNTVGDVRAAYETAITQGIHPAEQLRIGEAILLRLGLLVEIDGSLRPLPGLAVLARLSEDEALHVLAVASGATPTDLALYGAASDESSGMFDPALLAALGAAGEEEVVRACRDELLGLDRPDLAAQVQRVSLISDALGYDVVAPRINGAPRLLEVKTEARPSSGVFRFFLSRNEYDVGRLQQWALVACVGSASVMEVIGWCRSATLRQYLPDDRNGRWTEAVVRVPMTVFVDGLPDAV